MSWEQDVIKNVIRSNSKFITFDIKYILVIIRIMETLRITEYFMTLNDISATLQGRLVDILNTLLEQNYFNFGN